MDLGVGRALLYPVSHRPLPRQPGPGKPLGRRRRRGAGARLLFGLSRLHAQGAGDGTVLLGASDSRGVLSHPVDRSSHCPVWPTAPGRAQSAVWPDPPARAPPSGALSTPTRTGPRALLAKSSTNPGRGGPRPTGPSAWAPTAELTSPLSPVPLSSRPTMGPSGRCAFV